MPTQFACGLFPPILTQGQGKDMAPFFAFGFNYHLGQAYQGLPRLILPTKQDDELEE